MAEKTAQVNTLTSNLREATARINTLESEVAEKTARINTLESEVREKTAQISNLTNHLQQAGRQINDLTNHNEQLEDKLNQTAQSYNDAVQILYLSTLSLQACAIVLRNEMNHSQYLEEEFRKLADRYNDLLDNYQDFSEDVKSKARRRLVRKGIGVALAFVPGLPLIDILGDLGEILNVATEADAAVDGWDTVASDDIVKSVKPSSVAPEVSDTGMPVEGISLLPFVPKAQIGIEETLPQSFSAGSTAQDLLNLDTFVTDILEYMKDLVNSLKNTDRHQEAEAITKMINNLRKLGYKLHDSRPTTPNRRGGKSK